MKIDKRQIENLQYKLLCAVVITLPFEILVNSACLILFSVVTVVKILLDPSKHLDSIKANSRLTTILISHFLIYLIVFLFTGLHGGYILEKKVSLLLFPLVFGLGGLTLDSKRKNILLLCFIGSVLLAVLFALRGGVSSLLMNISEEYMRIQRPYFGLYLMFCVLILFYYFSRVKVIYVKIGVAIVAIFFLYFSYLILAKMAFVACGLTLVLCFCFFWLRKIKLKWYSASLSVLIIGSVALIFLQFDVISLLNTIVSLKPIEMTSGNWMYFLSVNARSVIWQCSWDLLTENHNWIFGYGFNYLDVLNSCYLQTWDKYGISTAKGMDPNWFTAGFNPHNQFLQTWLETGLIGFLSLILIVLVSLRSAIRNRDYMFFTFIVMFIISCTTESLLERQKGIVFFAVFNSIFLFNSKRHLGLK